MEEELLTHLQKRWTPDLPVSLMDVTPAQFKVILITPGIDLENVDRFVYEWRAHHKKNTPIHEMWTLFCFKIYKWDDYYLTTHLHLLDKYGLLDLPEHVLTSTPAIKP